MYTTQWVNRKRNFTENNNDVKVSNEQKIENQVLRWYR